MNYIMLVCFQRCFLLKFCMLILITYHIQLIQQLILQGLDGFQNLFLECQHAKKIIRKMYLAISNSTKDLGFSICDY